MNFFNMFPNMPHQQQQPRKPVDSSKLYRLLGISKDSTEKQIKKAYLLKSMKGEYRHPDKGGDTAKFQELKQAYEVLKDKQKRELYNKYGEESLKSDFQEPMDIGSLFGNRMNVRMKPKIQKAQPIYHKISVSLEDLCKGITKKLKITRNVIIDTKTNQIVDPLNTDTICDVCQKCHGTGQINITRQIGPGMIQQIRTTCQFCRGNAQQLKKQYKTIEKPEIIEIFIEKGSEAGDKIKISNKGNMFPGKATSDIIFIIEEKPHTIFQRKGNDLLIKKKISLTDALCGKEFIVHHPDNRYIVIKTNDIIKGKMLKCVNNGGMPLKSDQYSYGKLFILFHVVYPEKNEITPDLQKIIKKIFLHVKSFHSFLESPIEKQISELPENSEIDYETIQDVDPALFGKKTKHKSANDSDSEDEYGETQTCRTM